MWTLAVVVAALLTVPGTAGAQAWTLEPTPNVAGSGDNLLFDLACDPASLTACIAVGRRTNAGVATLVAERWNGAVWTLQTPAAPGGATQAAFAGVACTGASSCIAVGSYTVSGGNTLPLGETWNGSTWTVQSPANPPGATKSNLQKVSCSAASSCTARTC